MHRTIAFANHRICGSPAARLPNRSRMGEASALASTAWYFHIRRKPWLIVIVSILRSYQHAIDLPACSVSTLVRALPMLLDLW
jgi:hypothetical protein